MNIPKIRFKQNNGENFPDWAQVKIYSLGEFIRGQTYSRDQVTLDPSATFIVRSSNLIDGWFVDFCKDKQLANVEVSDNELLKSGDVVICTANGSTSLVGKASIYDGRYSGSISWGAFCSVFRSNQEAPLAKYFFRTPRYRKLITSMKQGGNGALGNLNVKEITNVSIPFPCAEEQQKIASFFSTLDQKIELNERKLEALEKLKKGLLRKIFDHEIRFKSDDGGTYSNWNESSLGNYFSVKMCKRIFKEETSDIGEVPFFKIGTFGKTPDAYISKELFEKYRKNFNYPSINDTLISCSGTVGRCVLFDGKASYFQDSNIVWLEPIDKNLIYNKIYLYIVLSNLSWHELSSTTIKRIYSKDLLSKKWPIPCIEEQNKIASLFVLLDKKITLFSQRLQSLKKLKKGFMQQMFV